MVEQAAGNARRRAKPVTEEIATSEDASRAVAPAKPAPAKTYPKNEIAKKDTAVPVKPAPSAQNGDATAKPATTYCMLLVLV